MTAIVLKNLRKEFGKTVAVDAVDLAISSGDLFFLLGPSGCGKTTLLRMIAGFIQPTQGTIHFGNNDVTNIQPNKRNTGMVFQNYALWPHLSVFENVAYGLDVRKVSKEDRRERTMAALRRVQMQDYGERKPTQLSGGQQQRIALARALVIEPTVLLLDEPLSNLDARLRMDMREQIRKICSDTGITTVYVTHDQKEALSMADAMAVLNAGNVAQVGPPRQVYRRPTSRFVADFLGETNFVDATVTAADAGSVTLETHDTTLTSTAFDESTPRGGNVTCSIRPEAMHVIDLDADTNCFAGTCVHTIYLGEMAQHMVELENDVVLKVFEMNPSSTSRVGSTLHLTVRPDDVVILPD